MAKPFKHWPDPTAPKAKPPERPYQLSFVNSGNFGDFPRFRRDHTTREEAEAEVRRVRRLSVYKYANHAFPALLYGPGLGPAGVIIG